MSEFSWPVRVYYEDTDCGGVVYYANYLKFMERARSEWLRSIGFEQDKLLRDEGVVFVVRNVVLDLHRPGYFNQLLNVSARVIQRGKATLTFEQKIMNSDETITLCTGHVKLACLDFPTWSPRPIPTHILAEITSDL